VLTAVSGLALIQKRRRDPEQSVTRRFRQLPEHSARLYVQPSQPVPVSSWDYTDPRGLQAAFDLGRRDAEAFARGKLR
jgi:hypothetical protein